MTKHVFMIAAAGVLLASVPAYALTTDQEHTAHHATRRHHVAHYQARPTMTDAQQAAPAAPSAGPETQPEYFGHAAGSDGAMPQ